MSRPGYIYVLEAEKNICKVGMTKYEPCERVERLWSRKFHRPLKLTWAFRCADRYECEKVVHELLKEYRGQGEWFHLPSKKIIKIIQTLVGNKSLIEKLKKQMEARKKLSLSFSLTYDMLDEIDSDLEKCGNISRQEWILQAITSKLLTKKRLPTDEEIAISKATWFLKSDFPWLQETGLL